MEKLFANIFLALCASFTNAQPAENKIWLLTEKLPNWSATAFKSLKFEGAYTLSDFINPFYIEADFNGDAKIDIAIAIEQFNTKKKGIIILHQSNKDYYILGAGKDFGNGGDDFNWIDVWKVYTDKKIFRGVGEKSPFDLKTKGIYVAKAESSSAVIYWTGDKYRWYQHSD